MRKTMALVEKIEQVLRMKEGTNATSYAKSSYIQMQALSLAKPMKQKAIREFYCTEHPSTLCIADLGCSSAEQNTLSVVSDLIESVQNAHRELGHIGLQEYQVYLNDLPRNDFNTIFRSLPSFMGKFRQKMGNNIGHCFVNGVPGSFYGRLFPSNHLHFVHSSYSLHWLSQVPEGIEDNKGNIYIAKTSPPSVLKAYYDQFEQDFSTFLRFRSEEVVPRGRMVLTFLGSNTNNEQYNKESCYMWELLATILNDMVFEGLIEQKKLNTFNIPQYSPSSAELGIKEKEGSFTIKEVHVSEVSWEAKECDNNNIRYEFGNCVRSVAEPLLTSHFGETIIQDLFQRYNKLVLESMAKEKNVFVNVTISLTRKG